MPTVMAQALANTHLCSQQLASIYFSAGVAVEDSADISTGFVGCRNMAQPNASFELFAVPLTVSGLLHWIM